MQRATSGLLMAALVLTALALAAGFAGRYAPIGDSLAVFRGALAVIALVLTAGLVIVEALRRALVGVVVCLASGASLVPHWVVSVPEIRAPEKQVVIYQKNLSFRIPSVDPILTDIRITRAQIVTLQEVTRNNRALLNRLPPEFVTRVWCPFSRVGGVAIASVYPTIPGSEICLEGQGMVVVSVSTPTGPMRLVSVHLHWPWPHQQFRQVNTLLPVLESSPLPTVVGGDFNMVRWSATLHRIAEASGTRPVGAAQVTFPLADLPMGGLAIDHVLAPGPGTTESRPAFGSDHRGLVAVIGGQ